MAVDPGPLLELVAFWSSGLRCTGCSKTQIGQTDEYGEFSWVQLGLSVGLFDELEVHMVCCIRAFWSLDAIRVSSRVSLGNDTFG